METIKYIWNKIRGSFRHRIGTTYSTRQHQYFNAWTGKVWFEDF